MMNVVGVVGGVDVSVDVAGVGDVYVDGVGVGGVDAVDV